MGPADYFFTASKHFLSLSDFPCSTCCDFIIPGLRTLFFGPLPPIRAPPQAWPLHRDLMTLDADVSGVLAFLSNLTFRSPLLLFRLSSSPPMSENVPSFLPSGCLKSSLFGVFFLPFLSSAFFPFFFPQPFFLVVGKDFGAGRGF